MARSNWLARKIEDYSRVLAALGPLQGLDYTAKASMDRRRLLGRPFLVRSRRAMHPLWCRPHSSDTYVFNQVFVDLEYACVDEVVDPGLIVDCGANVGYASAYFLSRFPKARLIAVEPDPDNARWLRRNLEPYGDRASVVESGVWSHPVGLVVEANHGDGLEWARQVRECRPGEVPQVVATDIATILENSGADSISILKVDVEGSESVIFASNYSGWLDRVENIAIELHGEKCEQVFQEAIAGQGFRASRSGELTFCAREPRDGAIPRPRAGSSELS